MWCLPKKGHGGTVAIPRPLSQDLRPLSERQPDYESTFGVSELRRGGSWKSGWKAAPPYDEIRWEDRPERKGATLMKLRTGTQLPQWFTWD